MEPQSLTWIIVAVVIGSITGTGIRRTRKGEPVLNLRPGVAAHVVFDGAIVAFATWGALFALDVPGESAHWFVLGAIAILLADVGVRHWFARSSDHTGSSLSDAPRDAHVPSGK